MHEENELNETNLDDLREKFQQVRKEFDHPTNVSIGEESTSFLTKISLAVLTSVRNGKHQSSTI